MFGLWPHTAEESHEVNPIHLFSSKFKALVEQNLHPVFVDPRPQNTKENQASRFPGQLPSSKKLIQHRNINSKQRDTSKVI